MSVARDADGLTRHQQHVVAHVVGCEVLGVGHLRGEALLVLDLPFIWAVAVDGAMALESDADTADRLELTEPESSRLRDEAQTLRDGGAGGQTLAALPPGLRVSRVSCEPLGEGQATVKILCEGGLISVGPVGDTAVARC